jgi:hypothetical protein
MLNSKKLYYYRFEQSRCLNFMLGKIIYLLKKSNLELAKYCKLCSIIRLKDLHNGKSEGLRGRIRCS